MTDRVCKDCIHFHACQSWTSGILDNTDARPCRNYETIDNCDAYYLGALDGRKAKDWISVNDVTPGLDESVLVLRYDCGMYFADIGKWNGNKWWVDDDSPIPFSCEVNDVEYWIPMPDDPEEANDGND